MCSLIGTCSHLLLHLELIHQTSPSIAMDKSTEYQHFLNVLASGDFPAPLTGQTPLQESAKDVDDSDPLTMFMGQFKSSHMPISQGLGHHQPIPVNHRERVPVNFATTVRMSHPHIYYFSHYIFF
jgi:hypothetical protein